MTEMRDIFADDLKSLCQNAKELAQVGLRQRETTPVEQLEVDAEDILWMLTKRSDAEVWDRFWNSLSYRPHNDDEWITVLMGMTICELVNTFGEAVTL